MSFTFRIKKKTNGRNNVALNELHNHVISNGIRIKKTIIHVIIKHISVKAPTREMD
jgi:hypothetical protein